MQFGAFQVLAHRPDGLSCALLVAPYAIGNARGKPVLSSLLHFASASWWNRAVVTFIPLALHKSEFLFGVLSCLNRQHSTPNKKT
jgi:hypothetical protein